MIEPTEETLFDVWLCHALHGYSTVATPSWSLGRMTIATCAAFATFMDAATKHLAAEYFEGEPMNVVEAWGTEDYVCWLVCDDRDVPSYIYGNNGLEQIPEEKDPR